MSLTFDPLFEHLCSETNCGCKDRNNAYYEWVWDSSFETNKLKFDEKNLEVKFHPVFSQGTAAARGNKIMSKGRHHYWEVKMLTSIYGTDVMVGVGTNKADLTSPEDHYLSLLGKDKESWGYSYKGYIQHGGEIKDYKASFTQGHLVGVHLDTWRGNLQFFLDRKPLGIAFTGLRGLDLYPMVSSTAAKSKMRIMYSCSMPATLQLECLSILRPIQRAYLGAAFPGLKYLIKNVFAEIVQKSNDKEDDEDDDYDFVKDNILLDDFDFSIIDSKKKWRRRSSRKKYPELKIRNTIFETS